MALTENTRITLIPDPTFHKQPTLAGAIQFFAGAICNHDASNGFVKLGANVTNELFAGIAQDELDQASGGSNGDNELLLLKAGSNRVVLLPISGITQAGVGKDVYVTADDAVSLTVGNGVRAGKVYSLTKNANEALILLD